MSICLLMIHRITLCQSCLIWLIAMGSITQSIAGLITSMGSGMMVHLLPVAFHTDLSTPARSYANGWRTRTMNLITLKSHARAPDPNNTKTITFNDGKPETIVEGEAEGLRMRSPAETVHYRLDEANPRCTKCGQYAPVWHGIEERWETHPMRCSSVHSNSSPSSANSTPKPYHSSTWRRW